MRPSPKLNQENKSLMESILYQLRGSFSLISSLSFIGMALYLKKKGILSLTKPYEDVFQKVLLKYDELFKDDPLYNVVHGAFSEIEHNLDKSSIERINDILNSIVLAQFNDDEYLHWYDYAIENVSRNVGRKMAIPFIPKGLAILAQAFIGSNLKNTFIPFGGILNFATVFDSIDSLSSFEMNMITWQIGMFRLGLDGIADKVDFECRNIIKWPTERYDSIISMPPFGLRLDMDAKPRYFDAEGKELSELIAPSRFIESTTDDGICVAFSPASLLTGEGAKKKFRAWATNNKILDTVILLPGSMLNETNIQLACCILRKKPFHTESVRMIDASGMYANYNNRNLLEVGDVMNAYHSDVDNVSRTVPYDEIQSLDFSWNVKEYLQKEETNPEGYTVSYLEDVVSVPVMEKSTARDHGMAVKISDLSDDWTHPYVDIDKLAVVNDLRGCSRLDRKAVLISSIRTLKPSIIEASEEKPVWINSNILVVIPNDSICSEYLCMTLSKMNIAITGSVIPYISKTYILRQKIAYPDFAAQKNLYIEAARSYTLARAKEIGLQEVIEQMKAEYIDEVRMRKHDMKPYLRQIRSCNEYLLLSASELPSEFIDVINQQKEAIIALSESLDRLSEEDKFGTPEVIDIDSYLTDLEIKHPASSIYDIEYDRDYSALCDNGYIQHPTLAESMESTERFLKSIEQGQYDLEDDTKWIRHLNVKIAKEDLDNLVQNILINAEEHGFTNPDRDDYEVYIYLTIDTAKDMFVIDFRNNGTPLPLGLTKERFGLKGEKAGPTGKTGIGGHRIKSIVRHYGGDYDIVSEPESVNTVTVRIYLPICHDYE